MVIIQWFCKYFVQLNKLGTELLENPEQEIKKT